MGLVGLHLVDDGLPLLLLMLSFVGTQGPTQLDNYGRVHNLLLGTFYITKVPTLPAWRLNFQLYL